MMMDFSYMNHFLAYIHLHDECSTYCISFVWITAGYRQLIVRRFVLFVATEVGELILAGEQGSLTIALKTGVS